MIAYLTVQTERDAARAPRTDDAIKVSPTIHAHELIHPLAAGSHGLATCSQLRSMAIEISNRMPKAALAGGEKDDKQRSLECLPGDTASVAPISESLLRDIDAIAHIDAVPRLLDVVCRTTGLGFAAVARVTEDRWIACAVRDEIAFGLRPGGELSVATTLCNAIRASGELIAIDEVATDAQYCGHPTPRQYGFQSYISVPIRRADGSWFGTLCAIDPKPAHVNTPEVIGLFTLFAELIGCHLDAGDRLVDMERCVSERTTALRESHHRLSALLAERTGWARAIVTAQEDERARLARELHDEMGQYVTALIIGLNLLQPQPADKAVTHLVDLVTRMDGVIHQLARNLRPPELDDLGLTAAITSLIHEWAGRTHVEGDVVIRGDTSGPAHLDAGLYRIVQEALSNIARHAHAHHASVILDRRPDAVTVIIEDDGVGFDIPAGMTSGRLGLIGMRERAAALGGTLTIESTPDGTSLFVTVPLAGGRDA